ncbi:Macro domain-containing protein VPA0103 [Linum perenne]
MSRLALSCSSSLSLAKTTLLHRSFILRLKPARMASSAAGDNTFIAEFPLSASSFLKINKGDITKWFINGSSDAIVNPANERMLGGGGADGAIHRAAGPELREACFKVPEVSSGIRCPTGEARITPNSLIVARDNNIEYVAFPAISCGVYGYPFEEAAGVAISTIKELANDFKEVHFVLFADDIYDVWVKKAKELL